MAAEQITPAEAGRIYLAERCNELGRLIVAARAQADIARATADRHDARADTHNLELEGICAIRAAILDGAA